MNIHEIILDEIDKMSKIDLQSYYSKNQNNKEWIQILSQFPQELQREIIDERPNGTKEDIEEIRPFKLNGNKPIAVDIKNTLRNKENFNVLTRLPQDVVNVINQNWGTNGKSIKVYDPNPERYFKYAKMPSSTAKPSIMINGVIEFGVGRYVAALIRGDKTINVWDIRR